MDAKITITGRLGQNPGIRHTKADKAVCNLRIAVNEKVKRGAGYVDSVTWHRVVLWQGLAEDAQSLRKGSAIRVSGFQKSRTFEGRDGVERQIVEIVADKFEALDSLPQSQGARSSTSSVSHRPPVTSTASAVRKAYQNHTHSEAAMAPGPQTAAASHGRRFRDLSGIQFEQ